MLHRNEGDLFRLLVQSVRDYAIFKLSSEGIVETWNVGAERVKAIRSAKSSVAALDRAELFEIERRTRAEAVAAVHAQDEFLSIASHELRTPVAAVKATAHLANRAIARGTTDVSRVQRHLDAISRAADRLGSLVEDLLDVSRLRTGQLQLRRRTVNVVPLLEDIVERYGAQYGDSEHEFHLSLPDRSVIVEVDPSRLEQVLDNFLSNAVKYSPKGGEIRVTLEPAADGVRMMVTDRGIGLPVGQEDRIFEPFGRASSAMSHQIPGLGLGLSICRQFIEAHGGYVWASSAGEHRGTTVGVWLPDSRPLAELPLPS